MKVHRVVLWGVFHLTLTSIPAFKLSNWEYLLFPPAYGRGNCGLIFLTLFERLDTSYWSLWVNSPWNSTIENVWTFVDLERSSISWTMDTWWGLFSKIFQIIGQFWQMGPINFGVFWGYLQLNYQHTLCHCVSLVHYFLLINHYFYK